MLHNNLYQRVGIGAGAGWLLLNAASDWTVWDYSQGHVEKLAPLKVALGFVATGLLVASAVWHYENRQQTRLRYPRPERSVFFNTLKNNTFLALTTTVALLSIPAELGVLAYYADRNMQEDNHVRWSSDHIKAAGIVATLFVTSVLSAAASFAIDYKTQLVDQSSSNNAGYQRMPATP
ncbi:MAG: hypothetical protein P1U63_00615 [Coxiellaceae bacterium]|nr:hypothetical protein [Coxiellaceae bacterium]